MIQLNTGEGMMLMDQALEKLVKEGKITKEDALSKARDIEALSGELASIV
jgi:Tfp pilus assembly pilus retraction ATPase PilT